MAGDREKEEGSLLSSDAMPVSANDGDREGAGSGVEPGEEAGAGYGNHAVPDLDGEPGDTSKDAR